MPIRFFLIRGEKSHGPYSLEQLKLAISQGKLRPDDLLSSVVGKPGKPAMEIPELSPLFGVFPANPPTVGSLGSAGSDMQTPIGVKGVSNAYWLKAESGHAAVQAPARTNSAKSSKSSKVDPVMLVGGGFLGIAGIGLLTGMIFFSISGAKAWNEMQDETRRNVEAIADQFGSDLSGGLSTGKRIHGTVGLVPNDLLDAGGRGSIDGARNLENAKKLVPEGGTYEIGDRNEAMLNSADVERENYLASLKTGYLPVQNVVRLLEAFQKRNFLEVELEFELVSATAKKIELKMKVNRINKTIPDISIDNIKKTLRYEQETSELNQAANKLMISKAEQNWRNLENNLKQGLTFSIPITPASTRESVTTEIRNQLKNDGR